VLFLVSLAATSFMLGFTGALMPGPLMFAVVNRARKGGILVGVRMTAGHGAAEFLLAGAFLLAAQILGWKLSSPNPVAIGAIAIAGGLLLGFLGAWAAVASVTSPQASVPQAEATATSSDARSDLIMGAVISASNPYWSIWWLAIGLPWILISFAQAGSLGFFTFMVPHVASDLVAYGALAYLVHRGVTYVGTRSYRYVEGLSGLALASFGILFIILGLHVFYTGQIPYIGEAPKL